MPGAAQISSVDLFKKTRAFLASISPARHSIDFASVDWFGTPYGFSSIQRHIVQMLWEAWENATPDVGQDTLLSAVGSDSSRMAHIFKGHPAFGVMIVPSPGVRGAYRLQEPDIT